MLMFLLRLSGLNEVPYGAGETSLLWLDQPTTHPEDQRANWNQQCHQVAPG